MSDLNNPSSKECAQIYFLSTNYLSCLGSLFYSPLPSEQSRLLQTVFFSYQTFLMKLMFAFADPLSLS